MHTAIRSLFALVGLVVLCLEGGAYCTRLQAQSLPTRLLTEADLIHQGSFTVPDMVDLGVPWANGGAPQYCAYTQGVIAYNTANNSLFLVCHVHTQTVAEISIPALGGQATQLQAPRDVTEGRLNNTLQPPGGPGGSKQIGGLAVINGKLVITAFVYYDADPDFRAIKSHFVRGLSVSAPGTVQGPFRIGNIPPGPAFFAGYMGPIPTVWQAALGGDFFAGQCCLGIVSRTSYGPSVSAVLKANLASGLDPVPAQHLVGYPEPTVLSAWDSTGPLFNGTTNMRGVLLPENSASVIFFGYHGMGQFIYQGGTTASPYEPHLWFYNANDLAAVKAGTKQWYEPRPYRTARLPGLQEASIGGVTLDPATGRIYVAENYGDGVKPRIHVFTISGAPTTPPPTPTDTDGDGVPDSSDACPTVSGPAPTGCPVTQPPPTADTTPPTLSVALSSSTVTLGQSVGLTVTANDASGLRCIAVTLNGADIVLAPSGFTCFSATLPLVETRTWTPTAAGTYPLVVTTRDNSAARNQATVTATVTVTTAPPPPPQTPDPIYVVTVAPPTSCSFTTSVDKAPASLTGTGIGVQFQRSQDGLAWVSHGSRDTAAPFTRSASLANRTWFFRAVWSSATVTLPPVDMGRKDGCQ